MKISYSVYKMGHILTEPETDTTFVFSIKKGKVLS